MTKADFDIWNEDEVRFSGTQRCINCWDQTLASAYSSPNFFLVSQIGTDYGKARVDGVESLSCPNSLDASMLGVYLEKSSFRGALRGSTSAVSGETMWGQGEEGAVILHDLVRSPGE